MTSIVIIIGVAAALFAGGYLVGLADSRARLFRPARLVKRSQPAAKRSGAWQRLVGRLRRQPRQFEQYDVLVYVPRQISVYAVGARDAKKRALEQSPENSLVSVGGRTAGR